MIGRVISHYKILEKLGEGGMGVLYKAEDTKLDRIVALKFLPPHQNASDESQARFLQEARAASALNHPNVCTIHDIKEFDDQTFIVMEFVEGQTLRDVKDGMNMVRTCEVIVQVLDGLAAAHEKGIVHRDIKTDNIMVRTDGRVQIMDFGLAKLPGVSQLTQAGATLGTTAYMSPEQVQGARVDHRTDIFSLGVVLYEVLTGQLPFKGAHEAAVMYEIVNVDPKPPPTLNPHVEPDVSAVVMRCLEKDQDRRYQSAREVVEDLRGSRTDRDDGQFRAEKSEGPAESLNEDTATFWSRWKFALGGALLVVLLLTAYWGLFQSPQHKRPSSIAVLPFKNLNADPSLEYFSDGMTETVISDLANIGGLTVISRTSVMPYKNSEKNTREIALDLNVTHILEGSVLTSEDKVRIFAQLIDAQTDAGLWAQTYDREMEDIFSIQSDVANKIAELLEVALGKDAQARIDERPTSDLEAYRLYLQGQYYNNLSGFSNIDTAIALLEQAIARDPHFALAHAVLAKIYITNNVAVNPNVEWEQKAYVAFQQALSLNPNLAEAYVARGQWYWTPSNNFEHERAIQDFEKAIELKPGLSSAYESLMLVQLHVGLLDRALENGKKGIEIEPTNMWIRHFLGEVYFFQGSYPEAQRMYESVAEQFVPFLRIALTAQILRYQGKIEEATHMVEQALLEYPEEPQLNSTYAILLAGSGRNDEAIQRMAIAIKHQKALRHVHHLYHNLAGASALMDLKTDAIEWLRMAADTGLPCYPLFNRDPNLAQLKSDADYEAFMRQLKERYEYYTTL